MRRLILTLSFKRDQIYAARTVEIEIKAFVTCQHEVFVIVNASANTPNMTVVRRTCLGKCCTSNYNRAREFEVYRFLFTHNLRRMIRTKGNRTIKR